MKRAINLEAAASITQLSKRTLWRRLSEGRITRQADDSEGRTMLTFEDVVPALCIPMEQEDHDLVIEAATGDAGAQTDLALLFLDSGKADIGLHGLHWQPIKVILTPCTTYPNSTFKAAVSRKTTALG